MPNRVDVTIHVQADVAVHAQVIAVMVVVEVAKVDAADAKELAEVLVVDMLTNCQKQLSILNCFSF